MVVAEELDIWARPVKETPHRFEWALAILKDGGKVRRAKWAEGTYIFVNQHNVMIAHLSTGAEVPNRCDWQDLSATDWQAIAG